MIRYRGIRGNDNEGDAERPREIIRLVTTIIDHSESHRKGDIYIYQEEMIHYEIIV